MAAPRARAAGVPIPDRLRLGISTCLLGDRVRYDGGHRRDAFCVDVLGPFVEWVPVCPEVELGLGVPRPPIRLVGDPASPRLVVEGTGDDLTARMQRYARARVRGLATLALDGYVVKRGSPSCGRHRVRVHAAHGMRSGTGRGMFTAALVRALPALPVEEEGRLIDPAIREHFVERVFAAARWRTFVARRPRAGDLVRFHTAHELTLLAHRPAAYTALGQLVASSGRRPLDGVLAAYGATLMEALAVRATRGRHANALRHAAGVLEQELGADERAELGEAIDDYRRGLTPLVVPLTLVKHHVRRLGIAWLGVQVYLDPHPGELMLRNHV